MPSAAAALADSIALPCFSGCWMLFVMVVHVCVVCSFVCSISRSCVNFSRRAIQVIGTCARKKLSILTILTGHTHKLFCHCFENRIAGKRQTIDWWIANGWQMWNQISFSKWRIWRLLKCLLSDLNSTCRIAQPNVRSLCVRIWDAQNEHAWNCTAKNEISQNTTMWRLFVQITAAETNVRSLRVRIWDAKHEHSMKIINMKRIESESWQLSNQMKCHVQCIRATHVYTQIVLPLLWIATLMLLQDCILILQDCDTLHRQFHNKNVNKF